MFDDNIRMNNNIIKACIEHKTERLLACLSTCIYPSKFELLHEDVLHDGPPHESNFGYAYAKRMMDVAIRACNYQFHTDFKCVSPTNMYGPNDNFDELNSHVIPALITKCVDSKQNEIPFIVSGSGKAQRQFVYSKDVARIMLEILTTEKYSTIPTNMIISTPITEEVSIKACAEMIATILENDQPIQFDTNKTDGQMKKTVDTSLFENIFHDFNFTPLNEGLKNAIRYYLMKISHESVWISN